MLTVQIFKSFTPEVVEILRRGGVGIIPTDTVYGLVGSLFSPQAIERIYELKGSDKLLPVGTVLINDPVQIEHVIDAEELSRVARHWASPVSVLLEVDGRLAYIHQGHGVLAFRVPAIDELKSLVEQTGPLATSSANFTGRPPAETLAEALGYFRGGVDFYVDGGNLSSRGPLKVIRVGEDGIEELGVQH